MTKSVAKWSKKTDLAPDALETALDDVVNGIYEASLGGSLFKKRVALRGKGKSGGSRVIVCFNSGETVFALYAFKKNEKDNITANELDILKVVAKSLLTMTEEQIDEEIENGILFDV